MGDSLVLPKSLVLKILLLEGLLRKSFLPDVLPLKLLLLKGPHYLLSSYGQLIDPYTHCIMDGCGYGRGSGDGSHLSHSPSPIGTVTIGNLQDGRFYVADVQGGRNVEGGQVRGEGFSLFQDYLFHQGIALTHHHSTLDLTLYLKRINSPAHIMGRINLLEVHLAGPLVHHHLGHLSAETKTVGRDALSCLWIQRGGGRGNIGGPADDRSHTLCLTFHR
ncbi:MAG: hypothetical protein DDT18_01538 [Actinobacteria bacterium]|nr:hypothetical protein [Actinomycetota bacterium]